MSTKRFVSPKKTRLDLTTFETQSLLLLLADWQASAMQHLNTSQKQAINRIRARLGVGAISSGAARVQTSLDIAKRGRQVGKSALELLDEINE